jgi:hypothetical protein
MRQRHQRFVIDDQLACAQAALAVLEGATQQLHDVRHAQRSQHVHPRPRQQRTDDFE